jgi:hypothetical protein
VQSHGAATIQRVARPRLNALENSSTLRDSPALISRAVRVFRS